jgi:hypothetical protein
LYLRYHIIKEYTILPTLPPPFNLFGVTNYDFKPFNRKLNNSSSICFSFSFCSAVLSFEQILNLRRREALAYESDVFEQARKDNQSDIKHQEKLDLHLRQLRKMVTHVKVTCEASISDG